MVEGQDLSYCENVNRVKLLPRNGQFNEAVALTKPLLAFFKMDSLLLHGMLSSAGEIN